VHHTLRKLLPFVLILLSATRATARQTSANQDAAPPNQTKVEGQVGAPKVKFRVSPVYTPEIRRKGISGIVKLHVFLATDGTVQRVEIVDGDPLLAEAAVKAVKQWIFEPVTVGGKPVEADTTVQVSFQILDNMACHVAANSDTTSPNRTKVEGQVMALCLKSRVAPAYPAKAKKKHIEGTVKLRAIIATDGSVQHLEVEEGEPILAEAALKAVKQWSYEPAVVDGKPVEVETIVVVIFELAK
jgi:TonB family protein